MTKKDYQEFAFMLNLKYKSYSSSDLKTPYYKGKLDAFMEIVDDMQVIFFRDNGKFNVDKFNEAVYKD
jgi:hypothetical protein